MENNQRNSRKRLNSLILLVAFTAVMLIVSTYAWFSTQKSVTLGGIAGKVNVAEGLQISLDALNWKNEIDLSSTGIANYFANTNATNGTSYDLTTPYSGRTNIVPTEFLPVSTTAQTDEGIGLSDLNMYMGEVNNDIELHNIHKVTESKEQGYYAVDFFLWNTSGSSTTDDKLRLEPNSGITLKTATKATSGVQNAFRIAFALFTNTDTNKVDASTSAQSQANILAGTAGTIKDVAIWEPNASGDNSATGYAAHVPEIVSANSGKVTIESSKLSFDADDLVPTYALTSASASATEVTGATSGSLADLYDWGDTPATGVVKQNTLQTTTAGVTAATQLVSVTNGTSAFAIAPNQYHKLRMYIWLEGQDVDCINYASLGGEMTIEVGLSKEGSSTTTTP